MQSTLCLVIALFETVHLTILRVDEDSNITVAGIVFRDLGFGSWMGFHDWLRKDPATSEVVGLRFTPIERLSDEITLPHTSYLKHSGNSIELFFSSETVYDSTISDDQSFQYNKFMRSTEGELILVVDISSLSADEITWIENIRA